jgi:hypothetical protein
MRTKTLRIAALAAPLLLAAACGESRERVAARNTARRSSCLAAELALDAKERQAALDTAVAGAEGTPLEQATVASHAFVTAYRGWADATAASADYADSASHARSQEDSVRWARMSVQARPKPVPRGTVGGNAAESYNQDFARRFSNPDHPCNKAVADND